MRLGGNDEPRICNNFVFCYCAFRYFCYDNALDGFDDEETRCVKISDQKKAGGFLPPRY